MKKISAYKIIAGIVLFYSLVGKTYSTRQGIPLINADYLVLDSVTLDGSGISIAIIDEGIDVTHPQLGGSSSCSVQAWKNDKVIGGWDFGQLDNREGDSLPCDSLRGGHGTRVAGIAAGLETDKGGDYFRGVATGAKLYSLNLARKNGKYGAFAMRDSLIWINQHWNDDPNNPIKVVLITGNYHDVEYNQFNTDNQDVYDNCDYLPKDKSWQSQFEALKAKGIVVISSSGNYGNKGGGSPGFRNGVDWPACLSSVNAISAVVDTGNPISIDEQSDLGEFTALLAPGSTTRTTYPGNTFRNFGDTSAAAPYAAGAAAVLQSASLHITNRYLSPDDLISALQQYGTLVTDNRKGSVGIKKPLINLRATIEGRFSVTLDTPR